MVARHPVVATMGSWVGQTERTGNNDIWSADEWGITGYDWCAAAYQSAFWHTGGVLLPHQSMYVPYYVQWARDRGEAIEVDQVHLIQPGDAVMFTWDQANWSRWTTGTGSHIGMVESYDGGGSFNTLEGNVGRPVNGFLRLNRPLDGSVICFWRPPVFDGGPFTISPEDDMFDETIDRQALQQTAAAAQGLVAAVAVLDDLLRNTYNNAAWASGGIAAITPTVQDAYNHAVWTWEKLKDVDFTAPPAALPGSPPAGDQADRLTALENRLTALEQGIARLVGPRPPVASPTAGPAA